MGYVLAVWGEFVNFIGGRSGVIHFVLFAAALVCCFFLGKWERRRLFFPAALVLVFFFNPFFYKYVGMRFLSGVYWRLLWMLPSSFVLAYTVVKLSYRLKKDAWRIGVVAVACVVIAVTGKPIFSGETYTERENVYELPSAAIEIADFVELWMTDWKETMIVPNELLCSIRQYSASACLLYGRNAEGFLADIGEDEAKVYQEMSSETPDVELITEIARNKNCRFIVFNTSFHQIPEDLSEYGYWRATVIDDVYAVYCRTEG